MDIFDWSQLDIPEKEKKILEAAIDVFSEKGFSAATTNEIAKNAGVAEGTIFRYFKTKKDILRGILMQAIKLMSEKVVTEPVNKILLNAGDKDIRQILKELLYDRMKLLDSFFPAARVLITEALYHEDVREAIFQNVISKVLVTFKEFHRLMAERGMVRSDLESEVLLRTILGNMFLLIAQRKLFGDKFKFDDLDKEFDRVIDVILYGISAKAPDNP